MARERSLVSSKGGAASLFLFLKDEQGLRLLCQRIEI